MIIFDAGNVRANKARALFNVALGEFLFLAQLAEAVANNHGCSAPSRSSPITTRAHALAAVNLLAIVRQERKFAVDRWGHPGAWSHPGFPLKKGRLVSSWSARGPLYTRAGASESISNSLLTTATSETVLAIRSSAFSRVPRPLPRSGLLSPRVARRLLRSKTCCSTPPPESLSSPCPSCRPASSWPP